MFTRPWNGRATLTPTAVRATMRIRARHRADRVHGYCWRRPGGRPYLLVALDHGDTLPLAARRLRRIALDAAERELLPLGRAA